MEPSRRWGDDTAILDDEEARRRLLDATGRCIVRRGNTQIRMAEVADEAGVSRSTVYRYFPGRDDVLLGLMLTRIDTALADLVRGLRRPDDPVRSLPEMVLVPVVSVEGNPLNEALFAGGSAAVATALEKGSEPIVELLLHHYEPLLQRWRRAGRSARGPRLPVDRRVAERDHLVSAGALVAVPLHAPTNGSSSSSSWCGPWCHRSDNNVMIV